jgi:hypothetical protein
MRIKCCFLWLALCGALLGCNSEPTLPANDEATLKNNLTRPLTAEERAKIGGSPAANSGTPPPNAAIPPGKGPR